MLGLSVNVLDAKRRKVEEEEKRVPAEINPEDHVGDVLDDEEPAAVRHETGIDGEESKGLGDEDVEEDGEQDEIDSMLGSDSEDD
ncbi:Ribosome production factor 1, partial [Teratosphaeriaceae sp. CCFEE 6253]